MVLDEQGHWKTDTDLEILAVPEGVRMVTGRRLERLSNATQKVLAIAAVIGLRFRLSVLEAAAPLKLPEELTHRVDQARVRYWYARMLLERQPSG